MSRGKSTARDRDWYKVSVETLKGWFLFLTLVFLAVGGYFGYQFWEKLQLKAEAEAVVSEAIGLQQQLGGPPEGSYNEYQAASNGIDEAQRLLEEGDYRGALARGREARGILQALANPGRSRDEGEAQFITVQGRVEFRRGERGEWEEARSRVMLAGGDYVKTSTNGSAEILFVDGTRYAVRPNTLFLVSAPESADDEQSIELQYGWIDLNTAQRGSTVATPRAEARVATDSQAAVSFDQENKSGNFATFAGSMEVETAGGHKQRLTALQTVSQQGDLLTEPKSLPGAPQLLEPEENEDVNFDEVKELELVWTPVAGAVRYALQISRNRLFVDNIIDDTNRQGATASLGLQGEGSFLWRVAAINKEGLQGPWAPQGRFRVASFRGQGDVGDTEPPELEVTSVQSYGSIFIISGHSEPAASVWINGESVTVEADGSFTKTIQIIQEGWAFVEVRAVDAWGNETKRRNRVFVEGL